MSVLMEANSRFRLIWHFYSVDLSVQSTVQIDENGMWLSGPTGEYMVRDVQIYNRSIGQYEDLQFDQKYRVGGINYSLRNQGDGLSMLNDCICIQDYVLEDYLVFAEYIEAFRAGDTGLPLVSNLNSPLSAYAGYLLDYENPYGSGRIEFLNADDNY